MTWSGWPSTTSATGRSDWTWRFWCAPSQRFSAAVALTDPAGASKVPGLNQFPTRRGGSHQLLSATLIPTEQSALRVDRKVPARMISLNKQLRLAAGLGLVGMALISAVPAAAAPSTDCGGVNDTLSFVASSVPLTLTGGTHTGTGEITLTC